MQNNKSASSSKFILVTPAKNEAKFIEETIKSVVKQSKLPEKWVIVSDGSTDSTDDIVESYTKKHSFITLVKARPGEKRNLGSRAKAILTGFEEVKDLKVDFMAVLDADISLNPDYYEKIIEKLLEKRTKSHKKK